MRSPKLLAGLLVALCTSVIVPLAAADMPAWLTESSRFQPGSAEVTARVTRRIDRLIAVFQPSGTTPEAYADRLLKDDARAELFRAEAVLRLYEHKFPVLDGGLENVKALEDGFGVYDEFKNKPALTALLQRSALVPHMTSLKSKIGPEFRSWGTAQDIPYVKKELRQILVKIRDGKYDFTRLEAGIHEYRRQVRWFPMTIDGLDGTVVIRDDPAGKCPAPALASLAGTKAAAHRYANPSLEHPAANPCTVSRCLMWQVSKTVRELGHLKDDAESHDQDDGGFHRAGDKATPEETARATAIRGELNSSHALDLLMSQISSCRES